MIEQTRALVDQQVRRVRRRLFMNVIAESLLVGLALGLALATLFFLVRPFAGWSETLRWSVPGGLIALGTIAGVVLAWSRRPSPVSASLALDEKFGLKERVTTFLTLAPEQLATAAGQALLHDVTEQVSQLRIAGKFPFHLPLNKLAVPAGAFAVALLACVFDPILANLRLGPRLQAETPPRVIEAKEVQKDRSTRLNSSHIQKSRMPSSA